MALVAASSLQADSPRDMDGTVIYQNVGAGDPFAYFSTRNGGSDTGSQLEVGNQVSLAPGERTISDITLAYYSASAFQADDTITLRLYNNGASAPSAGNMLYESSAVNLLELNSLPGLNYIAFKSSLGDLAGADFTGANTLTWTVTFGGSSNIKLACVGPDATIGGNTRDMWQNLGGTWSRLENTDTSHPYTFYAEIASVPEPSTMALLGLGGLAMAWKRRKS